MNEITEGGDAGDVHADVVQHASVVGPGLVVQAGRDAFVKVQHPPRRVMWPVRIGVPPVPAAHHRERQAHALLTEALVAEHAAVLVVSGLGGVGKTQLVAGHARRIWSDAGVDMAVWVSALSRDAVTTAYAQAASSVLVEHDPQISERPPEQAAQALRAWLAATSQRWLIVLDDVQDPADLRGLEPYPGPGGHVLVTSRRRDVALALGGCRVIELGVFTAGEAVDYLNDAVGSTAIGADRGQMAHLAEELGCLPLALGQAAAVIADQPLLTIAAYRESLAHRHRALVELTSSEDVSPEHQATVAATWSLSIERADRSGDPARPGRGLARPLLEIASLLDSTGTPLEVFTSRPVLNHLATGTSRKVTTAEVHDGLTRLHRFSLITLNPDQRAGAVAVHTLVQRAVRDTLTPTALQLLARTTADALLTVWPDTDTLDLDLAQSLRASTAALHAHTSPALWNREGHPVLSRAGVSLGRTGQAAAAVAYFRTLHEQARTHLGPDHPRTFGAQVNLARWRGRAGDTDGAVAEYEAVLTGQSRVLGPNHTDTLATRHSLAYWRGAAGDPVAAVAEYEAVLADRLLVLGSDHPQTLATRSNLARWLGGAGNPLAAVNEYQAVLADRLRVLSPDHPDTLVTRHNLAYWRGQAGDRVGAVAEFEAVLVDCLRVLGPNHPQTLSTRSNVARWRGRAGDREGAVAEYEAVLADRLRVLGPDHPDTLANRRDLTYWRGKAGTVVKCQAVLADQLRVSELNHSSTLAPRHEVVRRRKEGAHCDTDPKIRAERRTRTGRAWSFLKDWIADRWGPVPLEEPLPQFTDRDH
ncbi:tetratricopeptide repeat protein [Actinosynnema sp. NPDC091369]